jgi:hypothetical protein
LNFKALIVLLSLLFCHAAYSAEPPQIHSHTYFVTSVDDPTFSAPVADKSGWSKRSFRGIKLQERNIWVQFDFVIEHNLQPQPQPQPQGLFIGMSATYQAYWDGEYIGSNGVVGANQSSETPGQIEHVMLLPKQGLTPGVHTVSLKVSAHHHRSSQGSGMFYSFVSDYPHLVQRSFKQANLPLVMFGALLLMGLYCLVLYFSALRQVSYLWFSCLCLSILLLFVAESWRGLWGYSYDWHVPRLNTVLVLSCCVGLMLTLFFAFFFKLTTKHRLGWIAVIIGAQAVILLALNGYDKRSLLVFLMGVGVSTLICAQGVYTRQKNAWLMLIGLLAFVAPLVVFGHFYMEQYFFVSFAVLMALMLYTLIQTMQGRQQQLVQSQINASRLELELVKRNLQPHFILNTLTAVEEWIEDSPATAVKFINALADEFRYMAQLSSLSTIALKDEIELCQSHLRVMEYRANTTYIWTGQVSDNQVHLPPGIVLTLVENAISHNHYRQGEVVFELTQTVTDKHQLIFTAPVTKRSASSSLSSGLSTGTGNQYIEARLKECFGDDWSMTEALDENQWQVTLTMPLIP